MSESKPRNRSKNFESTEIQLLTELVEKNKAIINSKLSNTVTNERKKVAWKSITREINALGVCQRSAKQIKTKWTNMHQTAKKENSNKQTHRRKTGGGPASQDLSIMSEKMDEMYKDCPNFKELTGMEALLPRDLPVGQNIAVVGSPKALELSSQVIEASVGAAAVPAAKPDQLNSSYEAPPVVTAADQPVTALTGDAQEAFSQIIALRPNIPRPAKRKIRPDDVTQLQYEVLLQQKKKLIEQTKFYQLMNMKLEMQIPGDESTE